MTGPNVGATDHAHAWRGYEFAFDGEHPVAHQRCACGATRTIRAWERYWEPPVAAPDSSDDQPTPVQRSRNDGPAS